MVLGSMHSVLVTVRSRVPSCLLAAFGKLNKVLRSLFLIKSEPNQADKMTEAKKGRKVVIPVDGSKNSERAFEWYDQSLHKSNDEVLLVHAYDPYSAPPTPYPYGFAFPEDWEKHMKRTMEDAKNVMEYYEKKCAEKKFKCKLFKEGGEPGEIICNVAKDQKADQIIMGSRGMGTVRRTLVGSVSDFCLHHSEVPVSIVPPKQASKMGFLNSK